MNNVKYQGRISAIVERPVTLPDGKKRLFEYSERPPGVRLFVVADDQVLVTHEWREEVQGFDIRVPGGKVWDTFAAYRLMGDHPEQLGEAVRHAAVRELEEETGIRTSPEALRHLKTTACGATVIWDLHYFIVRVQRSDLASRILTGEGELIHPRWTAPGELFRSCLAGEVREDRTAAVLIQWLVQEYSHLTIPTCLAAP